MTDMETQTYYDRRLNTYQYTVLSKNCPVNNKVHTFSIDIPPFPFPTHQASSLAIFRLKKYFVMNQGPTDASRVTGDLDTDISGFVISVGGAGMRGSQFSNTSENKLTPNNQIVVLNKYGEVTANGQNRDYQRLSGSDEEMSEIVISNPSGTNLNFQVRDVDTFLLLGVGDGTFYSLINFEIELLPPDVSSGN